MMPTPSTTIPAWKLFIAVVGTCAALNILALGDLLLTHTMLNSDFMAFWSFPRFAATHPVAQIYDATALQAFQQALYPGFDSFYPYLYAPTLLLPIWWLTWISYGWAEIIWTLAGVAALAAAVKLAFPRARWTLLAALLASPAALITAATGETAFFTTALLLAGFGALPKWPALAGIAFGLLTLKPQLGILIPIFLLARCEWRAIATATLTALALAGLSCLAFPPGLWLIWAHTLPQYQAWYFASKGLNLNIIVTPAANLVALGVPQNIAWAAQIGCFLAVAAVVAWLARRASYRLAVAALLTGTFLAQPHAYAYDSVTLTAALALCITERPAAWQLGLAALVYLGPLLLLTPAWHWFLYAVPEAALLAAVTALALRPAAGHDSRHDPVPYHPAA